MSEDNNKPKLSRKSKKIYKYTYNDISTAMKNLCEFDEKRTNFTNLNDNYKFDTKVVVEEKDGKDVYVVEVTVWKKLLNG